MGSGVCEMLAVMISSVFYLLLVLPRVLEPLQNIMSNFGHFIYIGVSAILFVFSFIGIIVLPVKYKKDVGYSIFEVDQGKVWFAMQFFGLIVSVGMLAISVFKFISGGSDSSSSNSESSNSNNSGNQEEA